MPKIQFLDRETVLALHDSLIEIHGGAFGLRDNNLLESALNQPCATFSGNYVHPNIYLMGAAYAFHVIKNHPFIDGNKRTGIFSAIIFLEINGKPSQLTNKALFDLALAIAKNDLTKDEIAQLFESNT